MLESCYYVALAGLPLQESPCSATHAMGIGSWGILSLACSRLLVIPPVVFCCMSLMRFELVGIAFAEGA